MIQPGQYVVSIGKPEWGPGKVVHVERDTAHVFFRDRPGNEATRMKVGMLRPAGIEADDELDALPPFERKGPIFVVPRRAPGTGHGVNDDARTLVMDQLRHRGFTSVRETTDLNRRVIEARSPDDRRVVIVVKAKTSGTWQASTNDGDPAKARGHVAWVFVDLAAREFFIAPDDWVRTDIRDHHQAYLANHGGRRAEGGDSTHHAIQRARIEEWKGRWDVLA